MKLEYEAGKKERRQLSKDKREEFEQLKFNLRQRKKKEKKKGH